VESSSVPVLSGAFADLLRRHRHAGRLTQETLADLAGVSARAVRAMERGRTPRPSSVDLLATALGLTGTDRDEFAQAGTAQYWSGRTGAPPQPAPHRPAPPVSVPAPHQLPTDLPDFVGRTEELAAVEAALRATRLAAVTGPPGVGKTALAVHAGNRVADAFPDGQLFAVLRDPAGDPVDPVDVLADLLSGLNVDGSALPAGLDARAALFRSRLAGRRVLIMLDDAASHTQVAPVLPAGVAAAVVTGRLPLTGLPGVTAVDLRPLAGPAAVELLGRVAGAARVAAEPAAAAALVEACGGLPLAVRVTGAKLAARPQWTLEVLSERLADERGRLDELRHGDLAVRPGLQVARRGLSAPAGLAFALLGALPVRSFPEWTVAALLDCAQSAGTAALEELVDARLVDPTGPDRAGQPRYRFHDVTRLFARECRESTVSDPQWAAALSRASDGWLTRARWAGAALHCGRFHLDEHPAQVAGRPGPGTPGPGRPVEWFEAERDALAALVPACADAGLAGHARRLAERCADFYELPVSTLRQAKDLAAEVGDRREVALAGKDLGFALGRAARLPDAQAELRGGRVHRPAAETSMVQPVFGGPQPAAGRPGWPG
jgi:DNA-binding XRE family transcriptional regulator